MYEITCWAQQQIEPFQAEESEYSESEESEYSEESEEPPRKSAKKEVVKKKPAKKFDWDSDGSDEAEEDNSDSDIVRDKNTAAWFRENEHLLSEDFVLVDDGGCLFDLWVVDKPCVIQIS